MKNIFTLLFLFACSFSQAQGHNNEVPVEPRPYSDIYFQDVKPQADLKTRMVYKRTESDPKKIDTLSVEHFDKLGNLIEKHSFNTENGHKVLSSSSYYTYKNDLLVFKKIDYYDTYHRKNNLLNYTYDQNNNLIDYLEYYRRGIDTTAAMRKVSLFDANNNLIEKKTYVGSKSGFPEKHGTKVSLTYNNDNHLIKHEYSRPDIINKMISNYYYSNNNLDSISRVYDHNGQIKQYDYSSFKYDALGNMIYKGQPETSGNKEMKHYYFKYDGKQLIEARLVLKGRTLVDVKYSYQGDKISKIEGKRESWEYSSKLFYFKGNSLNNTIEYVRDKEGTLLKEKVYVNDQLSSTRFFEFLYH